MRKLHTTLRQITAFLMALSLLMISAAAEELLIMPAPTAADPWGLTLTLTNVTSIGATLTVTHSGEASKAEFFETGVAYGLEVRKDGQWEPLPMLQDWVVIAIAYGIPAGGSRDFELNWEAPYGKLPVGTYRVVKNISYRNREQEKTPGGKDYYAEFTITPEEPSTRSNPFTDVNPDDTFFEAVEYVYENGLMQGKTESTFAPAAPTTRGQMVTILWRLENMPVVNYILPFRDVAQEYYYTEAIRWAAAEKIAEGYTDGTFRPDVPLSRQQLATMLWRYAQYKEMDVSVGEDTKILSYNDSFDISEYAIPAIQWACGAGVMCGHEIGNLRPAEMAVRSDAAQMLANFLSPS